MHTSILRCSSASTTGFSFMKFGRAPATPMTRIFRSLSEGQALGNTDSAGRPSQNLLLDPRIRARDALANWHARPEPQRFDSIVAEVPRLNSDRTIDMAHFELLARRGANQADQLIDADVLRVSNVHGFCAIRLHESSYPVDEIVDVDVRANGTAVTKYLDRAAIVDLCHLSADGSRRLLPAAPPSTEWSVRVLEASYPCLHAEATCIGLQHALGVQLLPSVLVVRIGGIRSFFGERGLAKSHIAVDAN